jgi:hypothetical protein
VGAQYGGTLQEEEEMCELRSKGTVRTISLKKPAVETVNPPAHVFIEFKRISAQSLETKRLMCAGAFKLEMA